MQNFVECIVLLFVKRTKYTKETLENVIYFIKVMLILTMIIKILFSIIFILINFLHADLLKENFITFDLNGSAPKAVVDFESDNLEKFMKLDDNGNGIVSWQEIRAHQKEIEKFVLSHVQIRVDGKMCGKKITGFEVYRRVHQSYIKLYLTLSCALPYEAIDLKYDLFFDVDKDQKAFVKIKDNNSSKPVILSGRKVDVVLKMQQKASLWSAFKNFLVEGIWHIWIGYDHILFLMMLLIPSVYYYRNGRPLPRRRFKDVLIEVLKVVTGFSVAHSITLGLSVGDVVHLDPTFVEVAIALSVLFTAVNNLYPMITRHAWIMAFMFGLIHGFGFANVLRDLIIKNSNDFLAMLFGFNLGVEIGQLAIVAVVLPFLYILEKTTFYKKIILYGFSALTAVIAILWAVERAFRLSILPF